MGKFGRRTAAWSASGIRAERHLHDCLRTVLVLDDDRNLLARPQLCKHSCESDGRRGRSVVHGLDRLADPNPRLRGSPTGRDRADENAVPVRAVTTWLLVTMWPAVSMTRFAARDPPLRWANRGSRRCRVGCVRDRYDATAGRDGRRENGCEQADVPRQRRTPTCQGVLPPGQYALVANRAGRG
jgi:hypothetical protein